MRILIPNICYEDNFEDNVSYTLRKMGHEVLTMPKSLVIKNDKIRHVLQMAQDKLMPNALTVQEKWLIKNYPTFKPQLVLCLTQALSETVLLELQARGIIAICWWGDTASNMTKQGLLCKGWDFIYIKDKFAVRKLRSLDLNAYYLPEAMNPDWHKWIFTTINDSILFAGNTYEYRHYLIRKLLAENKYQIRLFGNRPPRWADPGINSVYQNKYIVKEEKSLEFGRSLACINSTAMSEFNSLNCRAFEIAGAGGLQILEYREAVEDCFEPGKEILVYKSFGELTATIDKYQQDPDSALSIREAGQKRALAEHTYEIRLNRILKSLV